MQETSELSSGHRDAANAMALGIQVRMKDNGMRVLVDIRDEEGLIVSFPDDLNLGHFKIPARRITWDQYSSVLRDLEIHTGVREGDAKGPK